MKYLDVSKMAVPRLYPPQQQFGIHLWTKFPLWELWDPATYAKGPGRSLAQLCIR